MAPRTSFDRMNVFLAAHKIRPVVDRAYAFQDAKLAYEHLARGPFDKVVIQVS